MCGRASSEASLGTNWTQQDKQRVSEKGEGRRRISRRHPNTLCQSRAVSTRQRSRGTGQEDGRWVFCVAKNVADQRMLATIMLVGGGHGLRQVWLCLTFKLLVPNSGSARDFH